MSLEWKVEKSKSGKYYNVFLISEVVLTGSPLAELKSGNKLIANYWGQNVKDQDIIEHAKSYFSKKKGLKLYIKSTNECYKI